MVPIFLPGAVPEKIVFRSLTNAERTAALGKGSGVMFWYYIFRCSGPYVPEARGEEPICKIQAFQGMLIAFSVSYTKKVNMIGRFKIDYFMLHQHACSRALSMAATYTSDAKRV